MTVQECYEQMKADYSDVLRRFGNEGRIIKFLGKLPGDHSFDNLQRAMSDCNYEEAFRAAHTLKGVSMNLGLSPLTASSSALTEALRDRKEDTDYGPLYEKVSRDHAEMIAVINKLLESQG